MIPLKSSYIYGENIYRCEIVRHKDADTSVVVIDLGFGVRITDEDGMRWRGIDAPEMNTPEGRAALARLNELLPPGSQCLLITEKTKAGGDEDDKYGRYLGRFYDLGMDQCFNDLLVDEGHAVCKEY